MSVEIRWRKVNYFDGTPYARKLARMVWSGGKGGDNIKTLLHKNELDSKH